MNNIFKILFLLLIITNIAYAAVTARVDSKTVELGETVTYSLNVSGENIVRPVIQRLCDTDVISTSSQTSVQIINGDVKKSYILSYKFLPLKSCTIEPIKVEINSKTELSNAVSVEVKPVTAAKDSDFSLRLSSEKQELFVGETFDLTLTFKQKRDSGAVDSEFLPPKLNGFWIKNESKPLSHQEGKYTITKLTYTMAAQRDGKLNIPKAQMRIASRGSKTDIWGAWAPSIKWKTYFSNELELNIKPLPAGVNLVGDFTISTTVDKKEVNANEAVNITIKVLGAGNLEDIKSFKPSIDGVSVFDEKISIEGNLLTQKIAFVAERDFIIPSFNLKFFNPKTQEVKSIVSDEISIKVKNAKLEEELNIQREQKPVVVPQVIAENDIFTLVVTFLIGLTCGVLIILFKPFKLFKKEKTLSIKEPKVLLMKLLPYKDDAEVKDIVDILEKNIYSGEKLDLDKKALKELLKRCKID
ncbi:BatD family protein [Candidatus Sulfurimonas marisnigri]|uniref:BatD family protein n=1 Tax=Candidatus Sulfurimonas marisnigri TaxID=2740405 RepID=A0A7S7M1F9_9BACT|nr:BatD family protein [Candidatus Sulfurimonas marisnigri]QOY55386.1 BatD family protein [Candidatus Sulfurimonas marisnigri]